MSPAVIAAKKKEREREAPFSTRRSRAASIYATNRCRKRHSLPRVISRLPLTAITSLAHDARELGDRGHAAKRRGF